MQKNTSSWVDEYEAMVVTIDRAERKMSLSLKQLMKDPWSEIETKILLVHWHKGVVRNINPYGGGGGTGRWNYRFPSHQ